MDNLLYIFQLGCILFGTWAVTAAVGLGLFVGPFNKYSWYDWAIRIAHSLVFAFWALGTVGVTYAILSGAYWV